MSTRIDHLPLTFEPPADLDDPRAAKVVTLNEVSRHQQVDQGLFANLRDVPTQAVTVTIPRLLNAHELIASVPGAAKQQAVHAALALPIGPDDPDTALRTHPAALLFLDSESDPRDRHGDDQGGPVDTVTVCPGERSAEATRSTRR